MRTSHLLLAISSVLSAACFEAPASSVTAPEAPSLITSGQPDAGRHSYVGLLVFDTADGPAWSCSGALLSPTVVLTAAHCTEGAVAARIWMDESIEANPEFPSGGESSYEGTPHTIPDFCFLCVPGLPGAIYRDIGIVALSEPVPARVVSEYVQLPAAGFASTLPNKADIDLVGYGVRTQVHGGGPPFWTDLGVRYYAPAQLVSGKFVHSDEFIRLTANAAQGKGNTCFGDSGGPNLVGGTDVVLAITSYGADSNCRSVGYSARIDIPEVLGWIRSFLE